MRSHDHGDDHPRARHCSVAPCFRLEAIDADALFDQIAHRLRQHPRLRGLSIVEIDVILGDAKREFCHELDGYEFRLARAFADAIEFTEHEQANEEEAA